MKVYVVDDYNWRHAPSENYSEFENWVIRIKAKYPLGSFLVSESGRNPPRGVLTGHRSLCVIYREASKDEYELFNMLYPYTFKEIASQWKE